MYRAFWLVTWQASLGASGRQDAASRLEGLVADLPGLAHARSRPALEGSVNGGDLVSHAVFQSDPAWQEARSSPQWQALEAFLTSQDVARFDWAVCRRESAGLRDPQLAGGVHRSLLLAVMPSVAAEKVARFEAEMAAMPDYLPAIRNWNLARVIEGGGARAWTHVWEQDFARAGDFFGPYMMHPIHFAHIDRWFDPQSHDWIVDTELCSTYCGFEISALALNPGRPA